MSIACLAWGDVCHGQEKTNVKYFGATPPGNEAEPFAVDFFSKEGDSGAYGIAFSDDGLECFYGSNFRRSNGYREEIRSTRYEDGAWTDPKPLLPETKYKCVDPHFSPDQQRLYFIYTKPAPGAAPPPRPVFDIWYVQRQQDGWSSPINIGAPISSEQAHEYYVSLTSDQTIYFGSNKANPKDFDLYSARRNEDGSYQVPQRLEGAVNSPGYEADVFVAPDETYVIFCSTDRKIGLGRGDLYISFRNENGTWREAINMGKQVNSKWHEFAPSLSPDGKQLFFSRGGVVHWVDAAVIESHRKTNASE
jgi:Tol biopolymer transport system component